MGFGLVGWKYAADLLLHSLSGSGTDLHYSSSSELAQAIVAAPQTIEVVNKFRVSGKKNDSVGVNFQMEICIMLLIMQLCIYPEMLLTKL